MIKIIRGEYMDSTLALDSLGKVYVPVGKEHYWFVKILDILKRVMKRENKLKGLEHNRLIEELGVVQKEGKYRGRKTIEESDLDAIDKYKEAMEEFLNKEITIDINKIPLSKLQEAQVTLQANDQVILMWLLSEE